MRIIFVEGIPSSGKSTLAEKLCARAVSSGRDVKQQGTDHGFGGKRGLSPVVQKTWSVPCCSHMMAEQAGLDVGEFIWTGGDCHLYSNHMDQVREQLSREPYPLPKLVIKRKPESVFDYKFEDFEIEGYQSHAHIKAPVAI